MTDGDPSTPRSEGKPSSSASKNCSVKRTCRSGTLTTQLPQLHRNGVDFGPEWLGHVLPRPHNGGFDGISTRLGIHRTHLGRAEHRFRFVSHGPTIRRARAFAAAGRGFMIRGTARSYCDESDYCRPARVASPTSATPSTTHSLSSILAPTRISRRCSRQRRPRSARPT